MEDQTDWDDVLREVDGTPASHGSPPDDAAVPRPPALALARADQPGALVLINQLLQSTFVALLVMAFLLCSVSSRSPPRSRSDGSAQSVSTLLRFEMLGEERRLSGQLLTVSALLSGIVGLYFTGLAITEGAYRGDYFRRALAEVRQLLAARAVYLAALQADADVAVNSDPAAAASPPTLVASRAPPRTGRCRPRPSRRCGQADPEPAGHLDDRAGQHEDAVPRQDLAEGDVVGDRRAGHDVERALRHRRLVAHLAQRRRRAGRAGAAARRRRSTASRGPSIACWSSAFGNA